MTLEKLAYLGPVLDEDGEVLRKSGIDAGFVDDVEEGPVGVPGFAASLEYDTIAALYAQGRDLDQSIGSGFENHADDTDRTSGLGKDEIVVQLTFQQIFEEWIFQIDQIVKNL